MIGVTCWRLWRTIISKKLAALTNETAHLAVREGKSALFIDHASSTHVIAISGQTGEHVPIYCSAHGKALLADFAETDLKTLAGDKPLKAYTKNTVTTIRGLAAACAEIKKRGYATDDGEYMEGVRCVAAPIRDHDETVIGSIGISAPITRFPESRYVECARQVKESAQQIGRLISVQAD